MNTKNIFTLRVNDSNLFVNRIVSEFSIEEALNYVNKSFSEGFEEFLVLENTQTKMYVQCVVTDYGFSIQSTYKVDNNKYVLGELNDKSFNKAKDIFFSFFKGEDINEKYSFEIDGNSRSFEI